MDDGARNGEQIDLGAIAQQVANDQSETSPSRRAVKVYKVLRANPDLDNWDVACFCVEYLAGLASSALLFLKPVMLPVVRIMYLVHYVRFEDVKEWAQTSAGALESSKGEKDTDTSGL